MKFLPEGASRMVARQALKANMNSPQLLFAAGVGGMVASTVLACKATLKVEEILITGQSNLNVAKSLRDERYSERDRQRDIAIIYTRTVVGVSRLYAPAIIVGVASVAALTKSQNILSERNAALTAAYAALDKGFQQYRARVVEKYGEEEDRNFRYGAERVDVLDEETGRTHKATRVGPDGASVYARFFDPMSTSWSKEPEYNLVFLRCQQNYANDMLRARGHLFLNEVYDMLGIPRSKAGSVVGWVMSRDGSSDNYVTFGIFDDEWNARDFVNGREGSILLDFNVDGVIFDKIDGNSEELSWQKS
jgi:hypothetical protein